MVVHNYYFPVQSIVANSQGILRAKDTTRFRNSFIITLSNKQTLMLPEDCAILVKNNWINVDGITLGTPIENNLLEFENLNNRNEILSWTLGFIEGNYDFQSTTKQINVGRAHRRSNALIRCVEYLRNHGLQIEYTPFNDLSKSKEVIIKELELEETEIFYKIASDLINLACFLAGYIDSCSLSTKDKLYIEIPNLKKGGLILALLRLIGINSAICKTKADEYYLNVWSIIKQDNFNPYINKLLEVSSTLNSVAIREAKRESKITVISIVQSKLEQALYQVPKEILNIFSIDGVKVKMI